MARTEIKVDRILPYGEDKMFELFKIIWDIVVLREEVRKGV
jgi:hypothetical protein